MRPQPARPSISGATLKNHRVSRGISLRQVAHYAGMSHGHLSKVENGRLGRPVTSTIFKAYSLALGIPRTENAKVGAMALGGDLSGPPPAPLRQPLRRYHYDSLRVLGLAETDQRIGHGTRQLIEDLRVRTNAPLPATWTPDGGETP